MLSLVNYDSSGESVDEDNADTELNSCESSQNIVSSKINVTTVSCILFLFSLLFLFVRLFFVVLQRLSH